MFRSSHTLKLLVVYTCVCYTLLLVRKCHAQSGLAYHADLKLSREQYLKHLDQTSRNSTFYIYTYLSEKNNINVTVRIKKADLKLYDKVIKSVPYSIQHTSPNPLILSHYLDSVIVAELVNHTELLVPAGNGTEFNSSLFIQPKRLGTSYLTFWVREAIFRTADNTSTEIRAHSDNIVRPGGLDVILGFPVIILRTQGVLQLIFRIIIIVAVTLFTFTMGCEMDLKILSSYFKKPIAPAIGFFCQFTLMPVISFGLAKLIPIQPEFGFGLLTVGCSPGGGASNAWTLLLGGDINLSISMTFVSSFCALFMMPFWLFVFGRFFIDVNTITVPYGHITIQMLQVSIPAALGLGFRIWKPHLASKFTKLTRPLIVFFIFLLYVFGTYVNWAILSLVAVYPIIIPASALLPWFGLGFSSLIAFILKQSKTAILTVAVETGVQHIGLALMVLLYSMPQPDGDLGALMPIFVATFTSLSLAVFYVSTVIHKRCSSHKQSNVVTQEDESEHLKTADSAATNGTAAVRISKTTSTNDKDYL